MSAYRTFVWYFFSFKDVTAVSAFPFDRLILLEHFVLLQAFKQLIVPSFMVGFYFPNHPERCCDIWKTFLLSYICKIRVKMRAPR